MNENKPANEGEVATGQPKQVGETLARWDWVERSVWTPRMLERLEQSQEQTVWFSLWDKVWAEGNLHQACLEVVLNRGSAGVDGQTTVELCQSWSQDFPRLQQQLREGTYQPRPARRVWIPKPGTLEKRPLGIPAVRDRVVQAALKHVLEPIFEREFVVQSYGFRPGKSAQGALKRVEELLKRGNCWVVDADLKGYFDNIPQDRLMEQVERRIKDGRVLGLVRQFLQAGVMEAGQWRASESGTPQGGVISPLLANIYLHPLDQEMEQQGWQMVRYADDFVVLCQSEGEAQRALEQIAAWVQEAGLTLHPTKTRIVYCQDSNRRGTYSNTSFDFLGYTFRPRQSKTGSGKYFVSFSPAVSRKAQTAMRQAIRDWQLHLKTNSSLEDLARIVNPTVRGWMQYYGLFHSSAMFGVLNHLDRELVLWARKKFKKYKRHQRRATHWLGRIARKQPELFAHWALGHRPTEG